MASLLYAITWIHDMDLHSIVVEIDHKQLHNVILSNISHFDSEFVLLVSKCKESLNLIHNSPEILVRQQANQVAHTLARGLDYELVVKFFYDIPSLKLLLFMKLVKLLAVKKKKSSFSICNEV